MKHTHTWTGSGSLDTLVCHGCNTATNINDLLQKTADHAAKRAELALLSHQVMTHQLKKPAHDEAYLRISHERPKLLGTGQEVLLSNIEFK